MDAPPSPRWTETSNRIRPPLPRAGLEIAIPPGLPAPLSLPSPEFHTRQKLGDPADSPRSTRSSLRPDEYVSRIVPASRSPMSPAGVGSSLRYSSDLSAIGMGSPGSPSKSARQELYHSGSQALVPPSRPTGLLRHEPYSNSESHAQLGQSVSYLGQEQYNNINSRPPPVRPETPERPGRLWREVSYKDDNKPQQHPSSLPPAATENFEQIQTKETRVELQSKKNASPVTFTPIQQTPPPLTSNVRVLPRPPPPPMSTSGRKILQLTCHDPRYDRTQPIEQSQFDSFSSSSSSSSSTTGSVYSQPGMMASSSINLQRSVSEPSASYPIRSEEYIGTTYLKPGTYHTDDECIPQFLTPQITEGSMSAPFKSTVESVSKLPPEHTARKDILDESGSKYEPDKTQISCNDNKKLPTIIHTNPATLDFKKETIYGDSIDSDIRHLVPTPLVLRPKGETAKEDKKKSDTEHENKKEIEKLGIIANAKDTMVWGIDTLTSPSLSKSKESFKLPSPIITPTSPSIKSPSTSRNQVAGPASKRSDKSPTSSHSSNGALRRRFTGAMKGTSHGKTPVRPSIISNTAREVGGPDTPYPNQERERRQGMGEVYAMAKRTLSFKSPEEKRRESLKKKIVVVGLSDQSPDGRCTEWL